MKGIDGMLLDVLAKPANYLQERKIRVALEGAESRWYHIRAGVPLGSILGPLMFLIYADDIVEWLECDIHLYADDAVLVTNYTPVGKCKIWRRLQEVFIEDFLKTSSHLWEQLKPLTRGTSSGLPSSRL